MYLHWQVYHYLILILILPPNLQENRKPDPFWRIMNKILIGALVCFLSFGNYFIFGCPAGLHTQFKNDLNMTEVQFMSLYSFANWPRVVISFIGGYLIDQYFGLSDGGVIFAMVNLISQILMSTGVFFGSKGLCYFASVVFGAGGPVIIAQAWSWVILKNWSEILRRGFRPRVSNRTMQNFFLMI